MDLSDSKRALSDCNDTAGQQTVERVRMLWQTYGHPKWTDNIGSKSNMWCVVLAVGKH